MDNSVVNADGKPRSRVSNACVPCRRSKVSCENSRPCFRCVKHGLQTQCQDYQSKKRGPKTISRDGVSGGVKVPRTLVSAAISPLDAKTTAPTSTVPPPVVPIMSPSLNPDFAADILLHLLQLCLRNDERFPPVPVIEGFFRLWAGLMTADQITFIIRFISSLDASILTGRNLATIEPFQFRMYTEETHQRIDSHSFSIAQLNMLPIACFYYLSCADGCMYFYPNAEAENFYEFTREEMQLMHCSHFALLLSRLIPPDMFNKHMLELSSQMSHQTPSFRLLIRYVAKSGRVLESITSFKVTYDNGGNMQSMLLCMTPASLHPIEVPRNTINNDFKADTAMEPTHAMAVESNMNRKAFVSNGYAVPTDWPSNGYRTIGFEPPASFADSMMNQVHVQSNGMYPNYLSPVYFSPFQSAAFPLLFPTPVVRKPFPYEFSPLQLPVAGMNNGSAFQANYDDAMGRGSLQHSESYPRVFDARPRKKQLQLTENESAPKSDHVNNGQVSSPFSHSAFAVVSSAGSEFSGASRAHLQS
eukprot:GILK01005536.1.p1 GENE.GILK01005536.1~~GILK01005536.1.p1  ORF type:complete len:562 (+),score=70.53 GILK01005536.1:97-1686(+)